MKKIMAFSLVTILLAGCATTDKIVPQTVDVAVAQHCSPVITVAPAYPDTDDALTKLPFPAAAAALRDNPNDLDAAKRVSFNVFYEVRLLAAGRIMRQAREAQLNTALDGCK